MISFWWWKLSILVSTVGKVRLAGDSGAISEDFLFRLLLSLSNGISPSDPDSHPQLLGGGPLGPAENM